MREKDHDDHKGSNDVRWMPVDFISFKRKGLTNDKISKMTGVPVNIINDHLAEIDEFRNRSGVF